MAARPFRGGTYKPSAAIASASHRHFHGNRDDGLKLKKTPLLGEERRIEEDRREGPVIFDVTRSGNAYLNCVKPLVIEAFSGSAVAAATF